LDLNASVNVSSGVAKGISAQKGHHTTVESPSPGSSETDESTGPLLSPRVPPAVGRSPNIRLVVLVIVIAAIVAIGAFIVAPLTTVPIAVPSVELGASDLINGNATFAVTAISSPTSLVPFEANLRVGPSVGVASSILEPPSYSVVVLASEHYRVYWGDVDGQSLLSRGDFFTVAGNGLPLPDGTAFTFYLVWKNPTQVVSTVSWTTPAGYGKPLVSFNSVTFSGGNATIGVAGTTRSVSPSNYKVNLQVGSNTGSAVAMPTTGGLFATMTINSVVYRIYWTDRAGERTLNSGDDFRVTGNNLPLSPAATSYTFYLLWSDGSSIQQTTWSSP